MIRPILIYPDTRLHQKSLPVPESSIPNLKDLIKDLWDTAYDANGLGLAAIQVGVALRVAVMDVYGSIRVIINPTYDFDNVKDTVNEACLSVPGIVERVERWATIRLSYIDENGVKLQVPLRGTEAQCAQHEIDHMDGIVIPDKFSGLIRERMLKQMRKYLEEKKK